VAAAVFVSWPWPLSWLIEDHDSSPANDEGRSAEHMRSWLGPEPAPEGIATSSAHLRAHSALWGASLDYGLPTRAEATPRTLPPERTAHPPSRDILFLPPARGKMPVPPTEFKCSAHSVKIFTDLHRLRMPSSFLYCGFLDTAASTWRWTTAYMRRCHFGISVATGKATHNSRGTC
jgi:hypothetical protein